MLHSGLVRFCSVVLLVTLPSACGKHATAPEETPPPPAPGTESEIFMSGARTAWAYVVNNTQPTTGLAKGHYTFQYIATWDIGSLIAATYCAHGLGIIDDATYDGRIRKILATLTTIPLFEGAAFNRFYDSETGQMVDSEYNISSSGSGWSSTDLGRLLTWLRIVAVNQPQYSNQTQAIVNRLNYSRLIVNGELQGLDVTPNGSRSTFSENALGYAQYAAAGFALWGKRATSALNAASAAGSTNIHGVSVPIDTRGSSRTLSEPYIMMGLETGFWNATLKDHAQRVLAAQQARYDNTGTITIVTEDALPDAPYFFYYYSVYHAGRTFVVEGPQYGTYVDQPRWVSAKAAFAWRAIFPTPYTLIAFNAVQGAAEPGHGWGAGVYEGTLKPTGEANLNTAGMILEAALYQKRGRSFVSEPIS